MIRALLWTSVIILGTSCSHSPDGFLVDNPPPNLEEFDADFSPDGTTLAFVYSSPSDLGQQGQLWVFTFADSALGLVGSGVAPSWSHDGTSIAYEYGSQVLIYGASTHATSSFWTPGAFSRPTWAPGDRWIAVDRFFTDSLDGIWAHSTTSDSAVRLLAGNLRFPQWSPDSSRIAFSILDPDPDIAVLNLASGGVDTLTHAGDNREPAWSKDGQWIAWSSQSRTGGRPHIWIMRADGSAKQDLRVEGMGPTWSPDGSMIVYSGYDPVKNVYVLWRMSRDGSNLVRLLGFWHGT